MTKESKRQEIEVMKKKSQRIITREVLKQMRYCSNTAEPSATSVLSFDSQKMSYQKTVRFVLTNMYMQTDREGNGTTEQGNPLFFPSPLFPNSYTKPQITFPSRSFYVNYHPSTSDYIKECYQTTSLSLKTRQFVHRQSITEIYS